MTSPRRTSKPLPFDADVRRVIRLGACRESVKWLLSRPPDTTSELAWAACPSPEWMVWLLAKLATVRPDVICRPRAVYAASAAIWRSCKWDGEDMVAIKSIGETARDVSQTPDDDRIADLRRVLRRELPERLSDALRALTPEADPQSYVTLITASVAGLGAPEAEAVRTIVTWEEVAKALRVAVTF